MRILSIMILSAALLAIVFSPEQGRCQEMGLDTIAGTVLEVDQENNMISLTTEDGAVAHLQLADDVEVTGLQGDRRSLVDLNAGDRVQVIFTGSGMDKRVSQVQVQR